MHPNKVFAWTDREEMLALVRDISFATIAVATAEGPVVAHVPVVVPAPDRLRFHVAKGNRIVAGLDGARAIVSVMGPDAYVSPDWYGTPDQVPTWNYLAVECEGPVSRLDRNGLVALLDDLSAEHEAGLAPKRPWTRGKMRPELFEGMLKGIIGYELTIEAIRGTRKLAQHKSAAERRGVVEALAPYDPEIAALMREGLE